MADMMPGTEPLSVVQWGPLALSSSQTAATLADRCLAASSIWSVSPAPLLRLCPGVESAAGPSVGSKSGSSSSSDGRSAAGRRLVMLYPKCRHWITQHPARANALCQFALGVFTALQACVRAHAALWRCSKVCPPSPQQAPRQSSVADK